jgi:hypothetical protein
MGQSSAKELLLKFVFHVRRKWPAALSRGSSAGQSNAEDMIDLSGSRSTFSISILLVRRSHPGDELRHS